MKIIAKVIISNLLIILWLIKLRKNKELSDAGIIDCFLYATIAIITMNILSTIWYAFLPYHNINPYIGVAFEEIIKLKFFFHRGLKRPKDHYLTYGLAFAMLENILYAFNASFISMAVRIVTSLFHPLSTMLYWSLCNRVRSSNIKINFLLVIPVLFHIVNNYLIWQGKISVYILFLLITETVISSLYRNTQSVNINQ